jgi:acyl-CoA hydrolase
MPEAGSDAVPPKSPRESASVLGESMMPDQLNNNGTVFGGAILALVDKVGGVVARRHARLPVVTVSIDRVEFREPIYAGEYVVARGRMAAAGRTSMDILVTVEAENLMTGVKRNTNRCWLTFVALGPDGRPAPVPSLAVENDEDRRLRDLAARRRERRLAEEREEWA